LPARLMTVHSRWKERVRNADYALEDITSGLKQKGKNMKKRKLIQLKVGKPLIIHGVEMTGTQRIKQRLTQKQVVRRPTQSEDCIG
jgi:hypothetical protein